MALFDNGSCWLFCSCNLWEVGYHISASIALTSKFRIGYRATVLVVVVFWILSTIYFTVSYCHYSRFSKGSAWCARILWNIFLVKSIWKSYVSFTVDNKFSLWYWVYAVKFWLSTSNLSEIHFQCELKSVHSRAFFFDQCAIRLCRKWPFVLSLYLNILSLYLNAINIVGFGRDTGPLPS